MSSPAGKSSVSAPRERDEKAQKELSPLRRQASRSQKTSSAAAEGASNLEASIAGPSRGVEKGVSVGKQQAFRAGHSSLVEVEEGSKTSLIELERVRASIFIHMMDQVDERINIPFRAASWGGTGRPTHNLQHDDTRAVIPHHHQLWANEGETPHWPKPVKKQELQVWHKGKCQIFLGEAAAIRLSILAPTACAQRSDIRAAGRIAEYEIDKNHLVFRVTGQTLARSLRGSGGVRGRGLSDVALGDYIVSERYRCDRDAKGYQKNRRFFDCISNLHIYYTILAKRFVNPVFVKLMLVCIHAMFDTGLCDNSTVRLYLSSMNAMLFGVSKQAVEELLLLQKPQERAAIWRSRRLFQKDDNDPALNSLRAIERMVEKSDFTPRQIEIAERALAIWQRKLGDFVRGSREELQNISRSVPLHRSSATVFFSRDNGGGGAEAHLIVGMYRLSRGRSSKLTDVWGSLPENLSIPEIIRQLTAAGPRRDELYAACEWFIRECDRRKFSLPYLCIYPEREPKSRTFMLLTYALQLGGREAGALLSHYLKKSSDTREVFEGFNTPRLMAAIRKDVGQGATHVLSLDSAVATDTLPHAQCIGIYEPLFPVMSSLARLAVEKTFSPTLVHVANGRPRHLLHHLTFERQVAEGTGMKLVGRSIDRVIWNARPHESMWARPDRVPRTLRTFALRMEIANALWYETRVLLKSPTGSGKTLLAATMLHAIIPFPSIAALQLFSKTLDVFKVPHNQWWSQKKDKIKLEEGEPLTILTTAYYVPKLIDKYPGMVVVLDEAETRHEHYVLNLLDSRRRGYRTLIMSATPDELTGEETTYRILLEGGTNFPVTDEHCTREEMITLVSDPEFEKSLICTFSEPNCESIRLAIAKANPRRKVLCLTSRIRAANDYLEQIDAHDVIVSTNIVRSSVTIEGLVNVFDLGLVYEGVDFALNGFESLVLFSASEGARIQLRGRVGRIAPGVYYTVNDPRTSPQPYDRRLLCRAPSLAHEMKNTHFGDLSRECNTASVLVEMFSQEITRRAGINLTFFSPLFVQCIESFADSLKVSLTVALAFEMQGLASRLRQLKDDEDMATPYEIYCKPVEGGDYIRHCLILVNEIRGASNAWFPNEFALVKMWTEKMTDEGSSFYTDGNIRSLALCLWRQIARVDMGMITGIFREFSVCVPNDAPAGIGAGSYCIAMGLSFHNGTMSCRGVVMLPGHILQWIRELVTAECVIATHVGINERTPLLSIASNAHNVGRQVRDVQMTVDCFNNETVYRPADLEPIWAALREGIESQRASDDFTTSRGSPMSSTASFPILNATGKMAADFVREETGEELNSSSLFGDDDFKTGSEEACTLTMESREALGLRVKKEATGIIAIRHPDGELISQEEDEPVNRAFALYTERFWEFIKGLPREILALKPAGITRSYKGMHHDELVSNGRVYINDMSSYLAQISRTDNRMHAILTDDQGLRYEEHARRITGPRRILSSALRRETKFNEYTAAGPDVDRLFLNIEAALLLSYPSTRGAPSRVLDPKRPTLGVPVISCGLAEQLATVLQGDCFFSLRGPPLKFAQGPAAIEIARKEAMEAGFDISKMPDELNTHKFRGWGDPSKAYTLAEFEELKSRALDLSNDVDKEHSLMLSEMTPVDWFDVV